MPPTRRANRGRARGLRAWLPACAALCATGAIAYVAFRYRFGAATFPLGVGISCLVFVVSDPMIVYFSAQHRVAALVSLVASAGVATALTWFPHRILGPLGVNGPSALIALARLYVVSEASARRISLTLAVLLTLAYLAGGWLS